MTVRIVTDSGLARIYAPYELRELIKTFPGRRWEPNLKCWTLSTKWVDALADACRAAGQRVIITDTKAHPKPPTPHAASTPNWAKQMFDAVGPYYSRATFRALTKILHPDAGGDGVLMQQLNDAYRALGGAS